MNIQNVKQKTLVMTVVTIAQVAKRELPVADSRFIYLCSDDVSSLKELSFVCKAGRHMCLCFVSLFALDNKLLGGFLCCLLLLCLYKMLLTVSTACSCNIVVFFSK